MHGHYQLYQPLAALVLANPLFAGLVAAVLVFVAFRFLRWRADVPFWASVNLLAKQQFRQATQAEEQSLLAAAERQGKRDFAAAQLADARRRHGSALKLGQLWWTWWQVRGLVGAHVPAPACTSEEDGLDTLTKGRLDNLPVSDLMRKW